MVRVSVGARLSIRSWVLAAAGLIGSMASSVAQSPGEFILGVGAHFAFNVERGYRPETQRGHLADLRVDSFRDDVDEDAFVSPTPERPLGARLDRLNAMVADRQATPVLILRGGKLADDPTPRFVPRTPAEIRRFADYSARVTSATKAFRPIYEIWNEWNMGWRQRPALGGLFGPGKENPDFSPENYVATASAAYEAIKTADPKAFVLTGAIGEDAGWTWTRRALKAGLVDTGDGISVHLYNHCERPEGRTAENLIGRAEGFHDLVREAAGGPPKPIYITEFGWPNDKGPCGIPEDLAAANIAQFTLWASSTGWLKGVWAYELRDSGKDKADREDNFGLYTYDNAAKPAACAYREAIDLSRRLANKHFRPAPVGFRWLEGTDEDGGTVWAIWTTGRDRTGALGLPGDAPPLLIRHLCSGEGEVSANAHDIGPLPLVVHTDGRSTDEVQLRLNRK